MSDLKEGDLVRVLPVERKWRNIFPSYTRDMDRYANKEFEIYRMENTPRVEADSSQNVTLMWIRNKKNKQPSGYAWREDWLEPIKSEMIMYLDDKDFLI